MEYIHWIVGSHFNAQHEFSEFLHFDANCEKYLTGDNAQFKTHLSWIKSAVNKLRFTMANSVSRVKSAWDKCRFCKTCQTLDVYRSLIIAMMQMAVGDARLIISCTCVDVGYAGCGLSVPGENNKDINEYKIHLCYDDYMGGGNFESKCYKGGHKMGTVAHEVAHAISQKHYGSGNQSKVGEKFAESFRRVFDTYGSGGVWNTKSTSLDDSYPYEWWDVFNIYENERCTNERNPAPTVYHNMVSTCG